MPLPRPVNHCSICGDILKGRTDKIFCTPSCKAIYHKRRKEQIVSFSHNIDKILHRNWVILQELYEEIGKKKIFVTKPDLSKAGFNFNYHTTFHTNKDGKMYRYIYNFGWMEFSDKEIMIVRLTKPK